MNVAYFVLSMLKIAIYVKFNMNTLVCVNSDKLCVGPVLAEPAGGCRLADVLKVGHCHTVGSILTCYPSGVSVTNDDLGYDLP